jgi:hypothetical protein
METRVKKNMKPSLAPNGIANGSDTAPTPASIQRKISRRGKDINYPGSTGSWGCPLRLCPEHVRCPFKEKHIAKQHYYRHGSIPSSHFRLNCSLEKFTIVYRWNSGDSDFNSCLARLLAREFEVRGIIPWLDKHHLAHEGSQTLIDEVGQALQRADKIVICISKGDLKRCTEYEDDFFAFELKTALDLAEGGKPLVVLLHKVIKIGSVLPRKTIEEMDRLHDGLGSRLLDRLTNFRRYDIDFGMADDNFHSILDGICGKLEKDETSEVRKSKRRQIRAG